MDISIITREQWKARKARVAYAPNHPKIIVIHHQGSDEKHPFAEVSKTFKGAKTIQAIQNYHMDTHQWSDIGYSALIAPTGEIYQGRPFTAVGAHTKGHNTGSIGIMLVGNFEIEKPPEIQLSTLKNLIIYLTTLFPELNVPKCLFGHKDFANTDCPGRNLYPIIFDWKTGTNKFFDNKE